MVRDEYVDILNIMGSRDVSQLPISEIHELCKKYLRSRSKVGKGNCDPLTRVTKLAFGGVTRVEIGNIIEDFKSYLLGTISSELDTLRIKKKQDDENVVLYLFCSKCRKEHPVRECPLINIQICAFCEEQHPTKECPSLLGLRVIYRGEEGTIESTNFVGQRRPLKVQAPIGNFKSQDST